MSDLMHLSILVNMHIQSGPHVSTSSRNPSGVDIPVRVEVHSHSGVLSQKPMLLRKLVSRKVAFVGLARFADLLAHELLHPALCLVSAALRVDSWDDERHLSGS